MSVAEVHRDTDPLFNGTHSGATGLTLRDKGAEFKSCGAAAGLAIYNDTDGSNGLVTSVDSEDALTCTLAGGTLNTWTSGDEYSIYKTSAYNTKISTVYTDKRYGRKVTKKGELVDGLFPEDVDLDEHNENVFGPGQPSRA
jgi:hypothetical protein